MQVIKETGKNRKLLLSESIKSGSIKDVILDIIEINYSDSEFKEMYGDKYVCEPIELYINSFGGSVYDGLALVDIMRLNKTPIHTICIGSAMSMGMWIFMHGHKKFMGKNSTLMYHEVSQFNWDKLEGIKQEVREMERLQSLLDVHICSTTLVTQSQLNDVKTRKAEWYIAPQEALDLKLIDGIL